ncbi:MAG TPA: hypothetical protein PKZ07_19220 [Sedimentisphaerales bacterium]|nr:hypothetical protein [Sedimentisphaerales bacterium]
MKTYVSILNYTVTHSCISVLMQTDASDQYSAPLSYFEGQIKIKARLEDLYGTIVSINLRKRAIKYLMHFELTKWNAAKLYEMLSETKLCLQYQYDEGPGNHQENNNNPHQLLEMAVGLTGKSEDTLIYELTTFVNDKGRLIPGKRSISDLSPKGLETLKNKLRRIIRNHERSQIKENS